MAMESAALEPPWDMAAMHNRPESNYKNKKLIIMLRLEYLDE